MWSSLYAQVQESSKYASYRQLQNVKQLGFIWNLTKFKLMRLLD